MKNRNLQSLPWVRFGSDLKANVKNDLLIKDVNRDGTVCLGLFDF